MSSFCSCHVSFLRHACPNCNNGRSISQIIGCVKCPRCSAVLDNAISGDHCRQVLIAISAKIFAYCIITLACPCCRKNLICRPMALDSCHGISHRYNNWRIFGQVNAHCPKSPWPAIDREGVLIFDQQDQVEFMRLE